MFSVLFYLFELSLVVGITVFHPNIKLVRIFSKRFKSESRGRIDIYFIMLFICYNVT